MKNGVNEVEINGLKMGNGGTVNMNEWMKDREWIKTLVNDGVDNEDRYRG